MANRPSKRRNFQEPNMELDLTPMMNLISILIPALLISAVFVEVAAINVAAPAIGTAASSEQEEQKPDKPPLNLTVTITDKGYTISAAGAVLTPEPGADPNGPTIPVEEKTVSCDRFGDTWPPPRAVNRSLPKCTKGGSGKYTVYNHEALTKRLITIKDEHPEEGKIIIAGENSIEFEALTDVMDASRSIKTDAGEERELFPEVVLSPGLS